MKDIDFKSVDLTITNAFIYLSLKRSFIVKANPLVVSVGEWHHLLVVPNEGRVVFPEEFADFVVRHETCFVGEATSLSWGDKKKIQIN